MIAEAGTTSFYINQYADEMNPCEPTLDGWARWLGNGGDDEWRIPVPVDGATFKSTVTRWQEDILANRDGGQWFFTRKPPEDAFVAVRWGPGLGWSPDNIVWGESEDPLSEWFALNDELLDDEEYIAVGIEEGPVMLRYHANPPRMTVEGKVQ